MKSSKAAGFFIVSVLVAGVAGIFAPAFAADQSSEELFKRQSEPGSMQSASPLVPTQLVPTQTLKVAPAKAPAVEKTSASGEEREVKDVKADQAPAHAAQEPAVPSPLEKQITSDEILVAGKVSDANPAGALTQFGYSYFKNVAFSPQTDVPVSADYLTGPGDTLVLNLWGSLEGTYELTVTRSGEIFLPQGRPVKVSGVPFGKLQELMRRALTKDFRDFDLSVNMGKLRTIKVFVVGEVASPGDYSLSSLSTLLNALSAAGGPTKNGSLRNVKLRHAGQAEETVDLYDFFTRGDKSRDIRLSSGDTIFVPVIGKVAAIAGNVKRPAIYELKGEKTLKDLLALSEGITATGYLQRVQISRVVANENKQVLDLNLDSVATGRPLDELAGAVAIQDLDIVRIFPINNLLRNHVRLEGHVDRPGFYALRPGMRLSELVGREHLLPEYYPGFLEVTRLTPPDLVPVKMVVELDAVLARDPAKDPELKEFDLVRVFSRAELERQAKVKVTGEVQSPGEYRLYKDMTVRDLLIRAGYPTPSAYLARAEISRLKKSNDKVTSYPIGVDLAAVLKGDPQANIPLQPFDELSVRKIPNWAEETERYITLSGEVRFPGSYPIYRGERLSSVIERAGGFTEMAYLRGAKFTRESLRVLQQKEMDNALAKAEEQIVKKQADLAAAASSKDEAEATRSALEGLKRTVDLLKGKRAEGRLLIDITSAEELKHKSTNVELKGGDALYVPSNPDAVHILGQVYNPASVLFVPNQQVGHYLNSVGGPTSDAEEGEIYLVKMDGTVFSKKQSSGFLFFDRFLARPVDSGDAIIVPQRYEKIAWVKEIKDIATILGQLALAAGVMVAAGL
jgi:polysaccharide biosynthesis/export protein